MNFSSNSHSRQQMKHQLKSPFQNGVSRAHSPGMLSSHSNIASQKSQMFADYQNYSQTMQPWEETNYSKYESMKSKMSYNSGFDGSNMNFGNPYNCGDVQQNSQNLQSQDDADLDLLLSPIILKAYGVLKNSQLNENELKQIEERLTQKLKLMKKYQMNFRKRMEDLLEIAEAKYLSSLEIIKERKNKGKLLESANESQDRVDTKKIPQRKTRTHQSLEVK